MLWELIELGGELREIHSVIPLGLACVCIRRPGTSVVFFFFFLGVSLLKLCSRKKGTLIINGFLGNLGLGRFVIIESPSQL